MSLPGRCATIQKETQRFKRLSHSIYECKYHIVFCPKYRYRVFKEAIGEYARQEIYVLCKQKEQIEVIELNVQPDHVTVCFSDGGADVDSAWEQEKLEARKMLENGDESPPSSARCVSPHLIFMDMVHHHSLHQCRRRAL